MRPRQTVSNKGESVSDSRQLIRVGHSPDPDDAFMFHALANGKNKRAAFRVAGTLEPEPNINGNRKQPDRARSRRWVDLHGLI